MIKKIHNINGRTLYVCVCGFTIFQHLQIVLAYKRYLDGGWGSGGGVGVRAKESTQMKILSFILKPEFPTTNTLRMGC